MKQVTYNQKSSAVSLFVPVDLIIIIYKFIGLGIFITISTPNFRCLSPMVY